MVSYRRPPRAQVIIIVYWVIQKLPTNGLENIIAAISVTVRQLLNIEISCHNLADHRTGW